MSPPSDINYITLMSPPSDINYITLMSPPSDISLHHPDVTSIRHQPTSPRYHLHQTSAYITPISPPSDISLHHPDSFRKTPYNTKPHSVSTGGSWQFPLDTIKHQAPLGLHGGFLAVSVRHHTAPSPTRSPHRALVCQSFKPIRMSQSICRT